MVLNLTLPPDTEQRLADRAALRGQTMEALACELIHRGVSGEPAVDEVVSPPHEILAAICAEEEDGGFSVFALNYPGVISQGETIEEAKANIAEAFLALFESRRKHGEGLKYSQQPVVDVSLDCQRVWIHIDGETTAANRC